MRNIDGKTSVYGIIGNPIGHTLSPLIHNAISEMMDINAVYVPFAANDDLESMVNGLYSLGVKGINVTVPYKTDIIDKLCGLDAMAQSIGAVNTLKYTAGGYYGYNTDILGLKRELEDEDIELKDRDIVILGAGGAARAVAFLCASASAASITVVNRTPVKAQTIADDVARYAGQNGRTPVINAAEFKDIQMLPDKGCIAFQCTNVGLAPRDDECVIDDDAFYKRVSAGIDLIYRPAETLFMKHVRNAGGKACNGLKMLLYQAVCAYEIWNDIKIPGEAVNKVQKLLEDEKL